jgi:putative transposase
VEESPAEPAEGRGIRPHHLTQDRAANEGRNRRNGSTHKRILAGEGMSRSPSPATGKRVSIRCWSANISACCRTSTTVISLYIRGMSTREIQGHLEEIHGAEVSRGR